MAEPGAWLRGPVVGISAQLQPVAHSLLQAREDLQDHIPSLPRELLWRSASGWSGWRRGSNARSNSSG